MRYPGPRKPTLKGRLRRAATAALFPRRYFVIRGSKRGVALTFDDGPDPMTREYLDCLDRLRVRATFFVLGERCEQQRDDLLEIVRRGHEVASHGFSHKRFPSLSAEELRDELERTAAFLPPSQRPAMVRPPQGGANFSTLMRCSAAGYQTVMWSLDSDDCRTERPDEVVARCATARPGEIILLHEGQRWTLDALPAIVDTLRGAGHSLLTVGDLLSS